MKLSELSFRDYLALGTIVFAVGIGYNEISGLKHAIAEQKNTDARQDDNAQRARGEFRDELREINRKLDRLIERK